ncbi:hypothetical protein [Stenotrophomonas sp. PS02289]|uniref:hypothetical protein n=1 Tax=Stenotrophomonas sp. PS02289 TaxID=2991422 RepID=UPI00249C0D93|nr:hypothetical protein [Stenotrophomonas sp. PS02289]
MHKQWENSPEVETSTQPEDHDDEIQLAAGHGIPWDIYDDPTTPFLMSRGHWLSQIGMGSGTRIRTEYGDGFLLYRVIGPHGPVALHVPRVLDRLVRYTEVLPYSHIAPRRRSR